MKKLSSSEAYELLIKDVIHEESDLNKPENRWVWHSIYVAEASRRIACQLNLDSDYAKTLGYVHDIGRKIAHIGHPILGYKYLCSFGFDDEARSCITHSFIDNDITLTAGNGPSGDSKLFIGNYLSNIQLSIYDNIVQLCDLFCLDTGFTTIERRLLDITQRKGVTSNSIAHFNSVIALKQRIEEQMGCSLYSLFPEIKDEDKANIQQDYDELMCLIKNKEKIIH